MSDLGQKLKTLAKVVMVLMILSALTCGIVYAISVGTSTAIACAETDGWSYKKNDAAGFFAGAGTFILIVGGGCLCASVAYYSLTALGEIVENSQENRRMLQQLQCSAPPVAKAAPKPDAPPKSSMPKPAVVPTPLGEGKVRCPHCGAVQSADRFVCWDCGVKFTSNSPAFSPSAKSAPPAPKPAAPSTPLGEGKARCPHCGAVQPADRHICWYCGVDLTSNSPSVKIVPPAQEPESAPEPPKPESAPADGSWICPDCDTRNEPDALFCYICGSRKP